MTSSQTLNKLLEYYIYRETVNKIVILFSYIHLQFFDLFLYLVPFKLTYIFISTLLLSPQLSYVYSYFIQRSAQRGLMIV